jgi:hypothetical protein
VKRLFGVALGILTAIGGFMDIGDIVANTETGARVALVNLGASFFITFLTLAAEIGGVALAIELATSVNYLLWVRSSPSWSGWSSGGSSLTSWRTSSGWPRPGRGRGGPVAAGPGLGRAAARRHPPGRSPGAAMTPYEAFFFSSGAVEEGWSPGRPDHQPGVASAPASATSGAR